MTKRLPEHAHHQRTARLQLRPPIEGDLDAWASWLADVETVRFMSGTPSTRADSWRTLAMVLGHWQLRGFGMWTAVDVDSGAVVGRGGLWEPEGWPGLEVGWLIDPAFRGRGYATEIAAAAVRLAFDVLDAPSVLSIVHVDNDKSHAVAQRLGMYVDRDDVIMNKPCRLWRLDRTV